jgi:hypothetical protein
MGNVVRFRIADKKRHHLERCQQGLQEWELYFESMLGSVRTVSSNNKR